MAGGREIAADTIQTKYSKLNMKEKTPYPPIGRRVE